MKVRFEFTLDDLVDASERTVARSGAVRSWRWQGMVSSSLISALIVYVIRSGPVATKLAWAVAGAIVSAILYPIFSAWTRKRRLLRFYRERFGGAGPYTCEVEITPTGVTTNQAGAQTTREWSSIVAVEDSADAVEFITRGAGTVIVRNRAFSSREEWRQFIEESRNYVALAHHGVQSANPQSQPLKSAGIPASDQR
jgi:hypothetical protein